MKFLTYDFYLFIWGFTYESASPGHANSAISVFSCSFARICATQGVPPASLTLVVNYKNDAPWKVWNGANGLIRGPEEKKVYIFSGISLD